MTSWEQIDDAAHFNYNTLHSLARPYSPQPQTVTAMAMQPQTRPQSPMVLMSYSPQSQAQQDYRMVRVTPPAGGTVTIGLDFVCDGAAGQAPVIERVHVGSPAHDAGLLKGDRILSASGTNMTTTTDVTGVFPDQLSVLLKQTFHTATTAGGRMILEVERFGAVFFVELGPRMTIMQTQPQIPEREVMVQRQYVPEMQPLRSSPPKRASSPPKFPWIAGNNKSPALRSAGSPLNKTNHICSLGHQLSIGSAQKRWGCNMCQSRFTYNPRLRCDTCDFDVCDTCAGLAEKQAEKQIPVVQPIVMRPYSPQPQIAMRPYSPQPQVVMRPYSPQPQIVVRPYSPQPQIMVRPYSPQPQVVMRPYSPQPQIVMRPYSPQPKIVMSPYSPQPHSPQPQMVLRPSSPQPRMAIIQMQPQIPEMETTMVPQHVPAPQIPEMEMQKPRIITLNDPENPYYNHYERAQPYSVGGQRVLTKDEYDFI